MKHNMADKYSKIVLVLVLIVMGYFGAKWKVAWIRSITCQCQCQKEVRAVISGY